MTGMLVQFEVGGVRAEGGALDHIEWLSLRQHLWRFYRDGKEIDRRRCGFETAFTTAWAHAHGLMRWAPLMPEAESELTRLVAAVWTPHLTECRRLNGDPSVPALPPLAAGAPAGCVYLVQGRHKYKIGFTKGDPHHRMRAHQTGSPERLVLVSWFRGTQGDERALHARFETFRRRGEWFEQRAEIRDAFYLLANEPTRSPFAAAGEEE
jgi:hypothetical protein